MAALHFYFAFGSLAIFHHVFSAKLDLVPPLVSTDYGRIRGSHIGSVAVFTRIPYAAPPIGELRFKVCPTMLA